MDTEGLGRKLLLTPSGDPRRAPEKGALGTVTASHQMLTLQARSNSLNARIAKRGCLGRGEAFGCPLAVCPPKRPRPFAHYRKTNKTHTQDLHGIVSGFSGDFLYVLFLTQRE